MYLCLFLYSFQFMLLTPLFLSVNQYYSVYSKDFAVGTFSLLQADNTGRNMYGVVVTPVPEPATWILAACGLVGLFVVRRFRGR